jgi:transcriptional regulator with XRE-family HTH domain
MKIRFQSLQESLRAAVWARLERGELTGKSLAGKAGFRQAHLSNFLNGKRGLSLQAMDRLLDVLHLDVLQLAGLEDAARPALRAELDSEARADVAVVTLAAAARRSRFSRHDIQDTVSFRQSFLRTLKPHMSGNRRDWTRFVVVQVDEENAAGMMPVVRAGAQVLLDRHHNAPPVSEVSPDLYAVMDKTGNFISRITATPGHIILRPKDESESSPVRLVTIPAGRRAGDLIIGRVRHVAMEI